LENKGGAVPYHHQNLLSGFIKKLLLREPNNIYRNFTFYTFSALKGHTKVSRKGLHFYSKKVTLVLSSKEKGFIDYIIKAIFDLEKVEIGALRLFPCSVDEENQPDFTDDMKFICISPLVLTPPQFEEAQGKAFISPFLGRFSELLYTSLQKRMKDFGYSEEKLKQFYRFQLQPDKKYLNKIKESGKKFARIYPVYHNDIKYDLRGYTLPFKLQAAREVNEFIYTCGLGECTHKGFGMVDIVDYMNNKTMISYQVPATTYQTQAQA